MEDTNSINYNILIEKAMRDVIKYALKKVQKENLSKNYCFMFQINTKHKGLVLPIYVKKHYPEEITLILQHQFENLEVKNNSFSVNLSFSGNIENVVIPFGSILLFSDQEAGLELRFDNYREYSIIEEFEEFDDIELTEANNNSASNNLIHFNALKNKN